MLSDYLSRMNQTLLDNVTCTLWVGPKDDSGVPMKKLNFTVEGWEKRLIKLIIGKEEMARAIPQIEREGARVELRVEKERFIEVTGVRWTVKKGTKINGEVPPQRSIGKP